MAGLRYLSECLSSELPIAQLHPPIMFHMCFIGPVMDHGSTMDKFPQQSSDYRRLPKTMASPQPLFISS